MNFLLRLLLNWFGHRAKRSAVHEAKRRSVLFYLKAVNGTRRAIALALLAFFCLQTMTLAFAGAVTAGIFLIDADLDARVRILFFTCLALFVVPALALAYVLSARVWFKHSGAAKMVEDLTR